MLIIISPVIIVMIRVLINSIGVRLFKGRLSSLIHLARQHPQRLSLVRGSRNLIDLRGKAWVGEQRNICESMLVEVMGEG